MESILQTDKERCYLCGGYPCGDPLDKHHIIGGAMRDKSEKYGLFVYLHHNKCHMFGKNSVHKHAGISRALKIRAQRAAMKRYGWTADDFRKEFYKSYEERENERTNA